MSGGNDPVCNVRISGTFGPRLAVCALSNVESGSWVVVRTEVGEEAAVVIVTPDQWLNLPSGDASAEVVRLIADDEHPEIASWMRRAAELSAECAGVVRAFMPGWTLTGVRFNLSGQRAGISLAGSGPVPEPRLAEELEAVTGVPVIIEIDAQSASETTSLGGGTGLPPGADSRSFDAILKQRLDAFREPGVFNPQGMPRLGSRVVTPQGSGILSAVEIRFSRATVELDTGDAAVFQLSELTEPGP